MISPKTQINLIISIINKLEYHSKFDGAHQTTNSFGFIFESLLFSPLTLQTQNQEGFSCIVKDYSYGFWVYLHMIF